jgi:hypothetical protein
VENKISQEDLIDKYVAEYSDWLDILKKYHTNRFKTNYRQYTAYTDTQGTETKISDPVAPEMVERVVQRFFERDPKFMAFAVGKNIPKEVTQVMVGAAEWLWTNPDMVQVSGTMRSRLKVGGREFCILGNTGVESFYNDKTGSPDMRIVPIEDIIFDPAKTLKTSSRYYVRNFVNLDYLKDNKEISKDGKTYGLFKNITKLERLLKETKSHKDDPSENRIDRSGSDLYDKTVGNIELITRYEGNKVCRFIKDLGKDGEDVVVIQEFVNDVLDDDPLDFAMDIEVPKQPYAFGLLDFINGLTHAKDLFLNQLVDYGSKVLNPPLFVDPSVQPINRATLANAWKLGGIVMASDKQATHKPVPPIGSFGFDMLAYLQQRNEAVAGVGGYLGGNLNQENDKTKGTKGGIEMLLNQAISPVKDRQLNLEESIIEPMINKWLKITAALMSEDEIKYVFITGQSPKWVGVTKNLLLGKVRMVDLLEAEIIGEEEAVEMARDMLENGKDPETEIVIDADWLIRVETGSMAEVDTEKEITNFERWVAFNGQLGLQKDYEKLSKEYALKIGIKEPEQYDAPPVQPNPTGAFGNPEPTMQGGMEQGMPPQQPPVAQPMQTPQIQ